MSSFVHPSSLGPFKRYKQASRIYKTTTRATDGAWYEDPLSLDSQWHIRFDGMNWISLLYVREFNQWQKGPEIPAQILEDDAVREEFINTSIQGIQRQIPDALGIIVHLANDFAINDLKQELDNPGALTELQQAAVTDPKSILEDSTLDSSINKFRIIPLPAALEGVATAVTHTGLLSPILEEIREHATKSTLPVLVKAVSAPLIAMMGLPSMVPALPDKPFVSVFQYPWFTVLSFFNEHKDLMLIRTIQHRGMRRVGALRSALTTSCASLELLDPDVFVFCLSDKPDHTIEERIRSVLPASSQITLIESTGPNSEIPSHCQELPIAVSTTFAEEETSSHTFEILSADGWATQDFLPMPPELSEIYPQRGEMRLLKLLKRTRMAIIMLAVILICVQLVKMVQIIREPEWTFDPATADVTKKQVDKLALEQQRIFHWNNLLEDRSKGWVAMELFPRLVDTNKGILAKSFSHSAKTDTAPGLPRAAVIKEWKITGYARDEARSFLDKLNTREGLNAFFEEIAESTGNRAYLPLAGNRLLSVNVRILENAGYRPRPDVIPIATDDSSYRYTFDLVITQRFDVTDPMAVNVTKAP